MHPGAFAFQGLGTWMSPLESPLVSMVCILATSIDSTKMTIHSFLVEYSPTGPGSGLRQGRYTS